MAKSAYVSASVLALVVLCLAGSSRAATTPSDMATWIDESVVADLDSQTLRNTICLQRDTKFFCNLIDVAKADPTVALLYNPLTIATVFAPTDRGINQTKALTLRNMGSTLANLASSPKLAAKFVRSHIVLGNVALYASWRKGDVMYNALVPQGVLTVLEGTGRTVPPGTRRQYFIKGPVNIVRAGFQDRWNLFGGKGFVQVVEDPIIPPPSAQ